MTTITKETSSDRDFPRARPPEDPSASGAGRPVILFDGVCNLCNASVNYVIDHDPEAKFALGSLQSEAGQALLRERGLSPDYLESIILVEGREVYSGSTAALRIARKLTGPAQLLWPLIVVPRFIRDTVYNWIARNRYAWFGKSDTCRLPEPGIAQRFI